MMKLKTGSAPGHPGNRGNWASSRKSAVGSACNFRSRVWFTIGDGILNEIYFPRIDQPCTRDAGLIVTDGKSFFSEEKCDTDSELQWAAPGVPAFRITNTHRGGRYRIHKEIVSDPKGSVVFQRVRFEALVGSIEDYRLYALIAPHLGDEGVHNTAHFGSFKGTPMLYAESKEVGLATACSTGWRGRSVGFVGHSDGWQDLSHHFQMKWHYNEALDGNVAMTGEIHLPADGECVLVLGFGRGIDESRSRARAALFQDFDAIWNDYVREWKEWHTQLPPMDKDAAPPSRLHVASATVLRLHEDASFPGARVASLSVPWGEVQMQEHASGYHAVWARDAAQSALGLLARGACEDARRTLDYLRVVQEDDGHWPQTMWADGSSYWTAIQIDSIAAPVLLYEIARQEGSISKDEGHRWWTMLHRTAQFICRNGPVTQQDRWERNGGFSPYTLALAIAALVIVARAAEGKGELALSSYLFETADAWNAQIENWTWCAGTERAREAGIPGHYARLIPAYDNGRPAFDAEYPISNSSTKGWVKGSEVVSPDVWGLVRYGLRDPHDERVAFTTRAVDATLRIETPYGPAWHRYNDDGYGETATGEPYCKKGIGRAWPLFTGERAHYELARGNRAEALRLFTVLENFDGDGLLPEQVWDAPDIPEKHLRFGCATGSARPLAWAHAEHLQLLRSLRDGRVFSCPKIVADRYARGRTPARHTIWRPNLQTERLLPGTSLRLEIPQPTQISWCCGTKSGIVSTRPSPVGLHYADLPPQNPDLGEMTFVFAKSGVWQQETHRIALA